MGGIWWAEFGGRNLVVEFDGGIWWWNLVVEFDGGIWWAEFGEGGNLVRESNCKITMILSFTVSMICNSHTTSLMMLTCSLSSMSLEVLFMNHCHKVYR